MRSLAAAGGEFAIATYQRFVSPSKGFRCAHHASTGGMTCSNYGLHALREYGFLAALPRIRERLVQCSEYATDPRKGKIHEDDPGPLNCGPGKAKDRQQATDETRATLFCVDAACTSCLFLPF